MGNAAVTRKTSHFGQKVVETCKISHDPAAARRSQEIARKLVQEYEGVINPEAEYLARYGKVIADFDYDKFERQQAFQGVGQFICLGLAAILPMIFHAIGRSEGIVPHPAPLFFGVFLAFLALWFAMFIHNSAVNHVEYVRLSTGFSPVKFYSLQEAYFRIADGLKNEELKEEFERVGIQHGADLEYYVGPSIFSVGTMLGDRGGGGTGIFAASMIVVSILTLFVLDLLYAATWRRLQKEGKELQGRKLEKWRSKMRGMGKEMARTARELRLSKVPFGFPKGRRQRSLTGQEVPFAAEA